MNPTSTTTQGTPTPTVGVSLDKATDCIDFQEVTDRRTNPVGVTRQTCRPWYPLVGHRDGLRRNDMITLSSAFWILAKEGGTAYRAPIPGTIDQNGNVVPVRWRHTPGSNHQACSVV